MNRFHNTKSLHSSRKRRLAFPSAWLTACLAGIALTSGTIRAELLVYEPFDYGDDWLDGKEGALGTTGAWESNDTGVAEGWRVHPEGELTGIAVNDGYDPMNPDTPGILNMFDGTVTNLPTSGGFAGQAGPEDRGLPFGTDGGTGNLDASIGLAPSVTATFQSGTTTWFSYVGAHSWDRNQGSPTFMICTDPTTNGSRGLTMANAGNGIGGTGGPPRFNLFDVYPHYFSGGIHHQTPGGYLDGVLGGHNGIVPAFASTGTSNGVLGNDDVMPWAVSNADGFGAPNIVIGKIEWDADTGGYDIITVVRFLETEELTEAAFDALVAAKPTLSSKNWPAATPPDDADNPSNKPDLDQSQFDTLNISSLKFFVDEIRIGTTFEDVVTGTGTPASKIPLVITPNGPTSLFKLTWDSKPGMLYNVRKSAELTGDPLTWTLVEGDIDATPPENIKNVDPTEASLFYIVEEFPAPPPPPLLNENFDAAAALPTGWTSNGPSNGTDWDVGTPSGVPSAPNAAESAPNCVGTNVTGYYTENADVSLKTPSLAVPAGFGALLTFSQFIDTDLVGTPPDLGSVRILDADNADSPIAGLEITGIEGDGTAGWTSKKLALPVGDVGGKNIKVEFRFTSNAGAVEATHVFGGFYIDNVVVAPVAP